MPLGQVPGLQGFSRGLMTRQVGTAGPGEGEGSGGSRDRTRRVPARWVFSLIPALALAHPMQSLGSLVSIQETRSTGATAPI